MDISFNLGEEDTLDFHGFPDKTDKEKKKSKCSSSHSNLNEKSQSKVSSHRSNSEPKRVFI